MPYNNRRSYPYRKRYGKYRKRGRWSRYKMGFNQLKRDLYKLKGRLNTELKVVDQTPATFTPSSSTAVGQLMNGIAQGLDQSDRIGRDIRAKLCQFSVVVNKHASATSTRVRIIMIVDQEGSNGAGWTDVFNANNVLAFRNTDHTKRIRVLANFLITVDDDNPEKSLDVYRKVNFKVKYNTTTSAASAIETNSVRVLMLSDEATNFPNVDLITRFRYVDN